MSQRRQRIAQDGHARELDLAAVQPDFVKAERAVPAQVRIDQRDRRVVRRALRRDEPFVRAVILDRIGLDADPLQVVAGLALGPAPDDVARQGDAHPGFDLGRPGGHFGGMLLHVVLDAGLIGFDQGARLGARARRYFALAIAACCQMRWR